MKEITVPQNLITSIRQVDGGTRLLYAATPREARVARETIRRDRAMLDAVDVAAIVDVSRDGSQYRVR